MSAAARLDGAVRTAVAEGWLPATAAVRAQDDRPWPVVLLTAFGAWLAAVPLFALLGVMLGDALRHGAGLYVVGALVLVGAIAALRRPGLPLFVEQLVVPTLIVGAALIGWAAYRDLPAAVASVALGVLALALALAIDRAWLRVVLGAAAATLLALAWMPWRHGGSELLRFWSAWHLDLLLWLLAGIAGRTVLVDGARARLASTVESVRAGWLLATLAGLAWWSGMTFLVGATAPGFLDAMVGRMDVPSPAAWAGARVVSALLALAAAGWAARCWPGLRNPASAGMAAVLVGLAGFMPALGATLLALSISATAKRWRLASTAALVAAWIVGGFYYQLAWPLTTKALLLVASAAVLGVLAWVASRTATATATSPAEAPTVAAPAMRWGAGGRQAMPIDRLGIVATAVLVVVAANVAIWQKEDVIAHGQPLFVDLAPADPRSLMQGDYMRLNFRMPTELTAELGGLLARERPRVVARRDGRDIATLLRIDKGEPLAAGELRIELTPLHGDWTLVSDAWSFAEGEAERWAPARYGEFRVDAAGRALLVGLRGPNLEKL